MRIVLVEDSVAIRAEMARTLEAEVGGVIVAQCDSSAEAVNWLRDNPAGWDLAIVDMFLREGHGFDVLKRCERLMPQQRAVMFSNYSRDPAERQAQAAGADRFFDKSSGMDGLLQYCRTIARAICPAALPAPMAGMRSSREIALSAGAVARQSGHASVR